MTEINAKVIGSRLAKLRKNRTQAEVAKAVGISVSALSMYECGERIPRDTIKIKISEYYQEPIQDIFFT